MGGVYKNVESSKNWSVIISSKPLEQAELLGISKMVSSKDLF